MKVELDARGNGIFIPRKLLDELEIDEANILISAKRMLQEACEEYLSYRKEEKLEDEIRAVPLEVLKFNLEKMYDATVSIYGLEYQSPAGYYFM